MEVKTVPQLVSEALENDKNGIVRASEFVEYSMRDDVNRTEAYLNSKHISGEKDDKGRDKPFFNIVMSARNVWYRATDIDRKDIYIRAETSSQVVEAFVATILLGEWMKKDNFGQFLNDWGLSLATHGSSIVKFVEKEGKLYSKVMDWNEMIVDPIDFDSNLKIERFFLTPAQLKRNESYNKDQVKALLNNLTARKTMEGTKKDNKSDYIELYEVHGELPDALLKISKGEEPEDSDWDNYSNQMHVVSLQGDDSFTLYSGTEKKCPYFITHLLKRDGITYTGGAIKNLFEAQWMVNQSVKWQKDQLDLASKILFQTSDGTFAGRNVISDIDNGDILHTKLNEPLTKINNTPDIVAMQNFQNAWMANGLQENNISESMNGQNPPSGTAWRQTEALLTESHYLFDLMTETKGLYLIQMFKEYVIPYFKKQLNNDKEVLASLNTYQIEEFDARYVPNEVKRRLNAKKKKEILSGNLYDTTQEPTDMANIESEVRSGLLGSQRQISPGKLTWKEVLKDINFDNLEIDVTGEAKDLKSNLATIQTALQIVASNPSIMTNPVTKTLVDKILINTGAISPLELSTSKMAQSSMPQEQPQAQEQVGGAPQLPNIK